MDKSYKFTAERSHTLQHVTKISLLFFNIVYSVPLCFVLQLECVGGSAGCYGYRPKVVQCVNSGFDGYDVQVNIYPVTEVKIRIELH